MTREICSVNQINKSEMSLMLYDYTMSRQKKSLEYKVQILYAPGLHNMVMLPLYQFRSLDGT